VALEVTLEAEVEVEAEAILSAEVAMPTEVVVPVGAGELPPLVTNHVPVSGVVGWDIHPINAIKHIIK
jgi:hypothetical protein